MPGLTWNLETAEATRRVLREEEEEKEARAARRRSHWYGVRTEASFLEKSRRRKPGQLRAHEKYLRDDIHCGIAKCPRCEAVSLTRAFRPDRCMQREHAEYVVPDAFSLLQCMELLEEEIFGVQTKHLLVLETVLQEALRIAPSRDATRLRNFFRDDRRMVEACCVHVFPDQNHKETFVEPAILDTDTTQGHMEAQAARDARAIVKTLTWYASQHIAGSSRLVFMTPETKSPLSEEIASKLGIDVVTCEDFVKKRFKHPEFLLELAVNTADAIRWWQEQQVEAENGMVMSKGEFPPHLPPQQLEELVQRGELLKGKIDVSTHNPMEAFVLVDKKSRGYAKEVEKVYVYGREAMNRGIHGDEVVIELLPKSEWRAPKSERLLVHYAADEQTSGGDAAHGPAKAQADEEEDTSSSTVPTGIVVGVLRRSSQFFVATVLSSTVAPGDDYALAIPMEVRIPKIRIRSQRMDMLLDKRLKVVIDHWPIDSMYPNGHYTAVLGGTGDLTTEVSAILVQNEIEEAPFCESALACLPECDIDTYKIQECSTAKRPDFVPLLDWQVPASEIPKRRDLRATHRVFSVDPRGCQDIDDAMSVRRLENGNLELGVHIADVSYFVEHDSALDYEGRSRGTTVYLVGQRLDMLPAVLSADLCSLHENVDRFAMSVIWELNGKTLEIIEDKTWYGRTIIRSCASMTYDQAHRILQGGNADVTPSKSKKPGDNAASAPHRRGVAGGPIPPVLQGEMRGDLELLTMISRRLARERGEEGGLDLSRSETFSLNVLELGNGVEIVMKESMEIHSTIAELMILANSYVAKKIVTAFPSNALLRRHPPPSGARFDQLICIAQTKDILIDASDNYTLQQSLVNAERSGRADAKTMALLKSLAVRVMSEAEYICANASEATTSQNGDKTSFAHYGLGLQYYTHFTSPIRRYADIIVHRQLLAAIALDGRGQSRQILRAQGNMSDSKTASLALPQSLTPSVLEDDEAFLDDLISDVDSKLVVEEAPVVDEPETPLIFPPEVLVPLSQHLNSKNRNAKQASRSCEELYLALYFSTHTVRTPAIITTLKQNGFLVYVPTYDLRAPVYIRDREGFVQMDPLLCGVRIVDTKPPTGTFAMGECIRMIPQAKIQYDTENERLDVVAPEGSCTFKILDEVEIQISCDLSGSNARVPQLQLLLVGRVKRTSTLSRHTTMTIPKANKSKSSIPELQRIVQKSSTALLDQGIKATSPHRALKEGVTSMYDLLESRAHNSISPVVKKTLLTKQNKSKTAESLRVRRRGPGRLVFGDYEPPTTQHYQQKLASYMDTRSEALEEELSIQRTGSVGVNGEDVKRLERDAVSRTMKLAAEKRHDRINRRTKAGH
ncbi:hypothetical protein Poli38472_004169 [Pythium oligandrum]|uniref:DIS3-like exonuclease 1 n=1 Tax=Pythium oligandrum TaxID=41045 RepID=A0A8K1FML7_PYTOL|nr:hypothetical protein Poli38472_004169 [Pythium oligandrum]|eukprot:TMW66404.1 hypothetical protein Poli38472_004169 [Pythium oligandrum]